MKIIYIQLFVLLSLSAWSQTYTTYHTGNFSGITTTPEGGICMMGGATEHDEAMKWFLERANGGDVLILRTSGSDGYNDYMYADLGVDLNSVETIVFNSPSAAEDSYVHQKIQGAEAIWFAGGDQWNYISYWRGTEIENLINEGLNNRNIVIGGTSAGMAILSEYYFSAENGTVTSSQALSNPYNINMTVDSTHFLENQYLENVITDTHYDDPERKGRHFTFLARMLKDYGVDAKGIACNEYTAVCVDENGLARVYGDYPAYEEAAYFLQINCEVEDNIPENCSSNTPLDWNQEEKAVKVYKVYGTNNGTNTFDLADWQTGNGGTWQNWYADNGAFSGSASPSYDCNDVGIEESKRYDEELMIYPNPFSNILTCNSHKKYKVSIRSLTGELVFENNKLMHSQAIDLSFLSKGMYYLKMENSSETKQSKILKY